MKLQTILASAALAGSAILSSAALALDCKGADVKFTVVYDANHQATGVTGIWAVDNKISDALKQSQSFFGPENSNDVTLPDYIQAEFPTPDGYWPTGNWNLSLDPKTGKAVFAFDDLDGDMRSFDLICR